MKLVLLIFMNCQSINIDKAIESIPWWKRWLTCKILNRRKWKTARAYSRVTIDLRLKYHPLFDEMWGLHERAWADVYDIGIPITKNETGIPVSGQATASSDTGRQECHPNPGSPPVSQNTGEEPRR